VKGTGSRKSECGSRKKEKTPLSQQPGTLPAIEKNPWIILRKNHMILSRWIDTRGFLYARALNLRINYLKMERIKSWEKELLSEKRS
jgi:hypothetical protein